MLKFRQFLLCTILVLSLVLTGTGTIASFEVVPEDGNAQFLLIDGEHTQTLSIDALDIVAYESFESASRLRTVTVSDWVGKSESVAVGDELVLNLFSDASYMATIDRVSTDVNDTLCVRGRLQGYQGGYVIILYSDQGGAYASIEVLEEDRHYILFKGEGELYYVAELDPDKMDVRPEAPPLDPPLPSREEEAEIAALQEYMVTSTLGPDDPATIDFMIVYTPAAEEWAEWGLRPGIDYYIAYAVAQTQLVLDNSDTGVTLELVHSARVDYTEHGSGSVDLRRLRLPNDDEMDEVHQWRDMYGADLVQLFCIVNDVAGCGYILEDRDGYPHLAFSLVDIGYVYSLVQPGVPAHEIGHNLGCDHHENDDPPGPTDWEDWDENDWSAGYRFLWAGKSHCTVMAYRDDYRTRVPHFSNPDVDYYGVPTGNRDDNPETQDHDNARTIREIKHVAAAYEEIVIEDFEWGSDGTSLGVEPPLGDVDWTVEKVGWGESAVAEIDTGEKYSGTKSARFYRNNVLCYMRAYYSQSSPTYRKFYLKKEDNTVPFTVTGDGTHAIRVRVNSNEEVQYYDGSWQPVCELTETEDGWYCIEFRNINWAGATYDIYVDGEEEITEAAMDEYSAWNGKTVYYCSWPGAGTFWIDDIA